MNSVRLERAERAKVLASLDYRNVAYHAADVGKRLGWYGPEHRVALALLAEKRSALVAAYDVVHGAILGVPVARAAP